jgi:hypothetical protein
MQTVTGVGTYHLPRNNLETPAREHVLPRARETFA